MLTLSFSRILSFVCRLLLLAVLVAYSSWHTILSACFAIELRWRHLRCCSGQRLSRSPSFDMRVRREERPVVSWLAFGQSVGIDADRFDASYLAACAVGSASVALVLPTTLRFSIGFWGATFPSYGSNLRVRLAGRAVSFFGGDISGVDAAVNVLSGSEFYTLARHWMSFTVGIAMASKASCLARWFYLPQKHVCFHARCLCRTIGRRRLRRIRCPAFVAFPWGFLIFGLLYATRFVCDALGMSGWLCFRAVQRHFHDGSDRRRVLRAEGDGFVAYLLRHKEEDLLGRIVVCALTTAFVARGRAFADAQPISFRVEICLTIQLMFGSCGWLYHGRAR